MYYNNINGYQSKEHSFLNIIKDVTPDVIALCETKREDMKTTKKEDEIPGYAVIENDLKKGKEGLLFAAKKGLESYCHISNIPMLEFVSTTFKT